ncbi:MAG: iron-containing alcohol dehydrogenase [Candidatus Saccharimonas sp.]|nr:iron-containing alcohol dehydrogenase [Planctomycetaceae bacterium]
MLNYSFFAPHQIVFGWGRRAELGTLAAQRGRRALLVSGSRTLERSGVIDPMESQLRTAGLDVLRFSTASREPEVRDVDQLTAEFRSLEPTVADVVIAVGGGSTIDLAKAAAALATNRQGDSVVDFLEGVGCGLQITQPPLTLIAVPTTAGTGAEATKNAVISSNNDTAESGLDGAPAVPYKKSLRSELMVPRLVLVDPELSVSVPPDVTAFTGMDAITQLIESYISRRAAPIPQGLCLHGLKLAIPALPTAVQDGSSRVAREAMAHAALLSGMALANSGLGFAHGVAAALGVTCRVPHGLACAVMLPAALQLNLPVRTRELADLERLFDPEVGIDPVAANAFVDRIESLCESLNIPARLRDIGVKHDQLAALVPGSRGNSMSGNPRDVSDQKLVEILEAMW